jgi:hypothetical protein
LTPFCAAVVKILKAAHQQSMDADSLRKAVMKAGFGKHPAGVAMHLTKLAWKEQYVTQYCHRDNYRVFMLTSEGAA